MKQTTKVIQQIFLIYLLCYLARIVEYFILRTDQTIIGEAFIHKLFGIAVVIFVMKKSGYGFSDIGISKTGIFKYTMLGLLLGLSMFTIGYFIEFLLLKSQQGIAAIEFYVSAYAVDQNIATQTGIFFILICIIGNLINVMMEEGLFRGLFPRMLNQKSFFPVAIFCSVLFGFWHIIGPIRNYVDGMSSFQGMVANCLMLLISSFLIALKFAMLAHIEGALYMGMADHFVNNTIVNLLHVVGKTGADEMMFLRISIAQGISFVIVLILYFLHKKKCKEC